MSKSALSTFDFVPSWQCMTREDDAQVQAFWHREHAGLVGEAAAQRVRQIVLRVIDKTGRLVAVSTVEPRTIPRLMQPMYYYRCFIGANWRTRSLLRPLLHESFHVLDAWARRHDFPCIGVLLELENAGFGRALQKAYWAVSPDMGFSFIGRSARGLDLRVCYFRGARLKTPR